MSNQIELKNVKKGEYIKRKIDAKNVFIRGEYIRELKKFELIDCEDINRQIYLSGKSIVFVGFTY
jgi:hypothetical protein